MNYYIFCLLKNTLRCMINKIGYFDYGALKINAEYRSVESNGELVQLTNYEFEILYLLAKKSRTDIFKGTNIYTGVERTILWGRR
ncbi:MAG: hypothetical protein ACLVJG_08185 [Coprococcus comes]